MKKFITITIAMILTAITAMAQLTLPDFGTTGAWNGMKPYNTTKYGDNIRKVVDGVYTNMAALPVYKYNAHGSSLQAVNYDPALAKDSIALVDNQLLLASVVIDKPMTITGIKALLAVSNDAIQKTTLNRIGLYKFVNDTLATLVDSTANDTTLWTGTARSVYTKAFDTTYVAAPGVYMVGILYNYLSATTAGQIFADLLRGPFISEFDFGTDERKLACYIASQNDLPKTIDMKAATTVATRNRFWFGLY